MILEGLKGLLSHYPSITVQATFQNPKEALSYLDRHAVDVIFTDLDMPTIKGEDVVMYCKSKFPSTPIIVLSMHNEQSVIRYLINLGADGYLTKSSGKEDFFAAITTVKQGAKYFSEEVIQSLVSKPKAHPASSIITEQLSAREIEIVIQIAQGQTSKEIGELLHISHRTVETHRTNIQRKLGVNGVAGIVRFAFQNQLIE